MDTLCTIKIVKSSALEPSDVAPRSSLITYSYGLIERLHSVSFPSVWTPSLHLMDPARCRPLTPIARRALPRLLLAVFRALCF